MLGFKRKKPISYSNLLIEFIDPILTGEEDEEEFLEKVKTGVTAWNFCVAEHAKLGIESTIKQIMEDYIREAPKWLKEIIDKLIIRKQTQYGHHDQYIMTAETRRKADGSVTLNVESAPVEVLKSLGV